MSKKILFIEDEKDFAKLVTAYLKKNNFRVVMVSSGKAALSKLKKQRYDLILLDLGLPDMDGLKLSQRIRETEETPIFILTARGRVEDRVAAFNLGADDYLAKPVSLKELVVRIKRLLKRNLKNNFRSSVFEFDNIRFDTVKGRLSSSKKSVKLTGKEKLVLEYFLLHKNQVLTRAEIMDHVWGKELDIFSNVVNVIISSLREKLRQLSEKKFIDSAHGLGYKFEIDNNN